MSYEGYEQFLCEDGHYQEREAYDDPVQVCHCGKPIVWYNSVDLTNGSFDDEGIRIDGYIELQVKAEATYEECPHCHHSELKSEVTYHIPADKGQHATPISIDNWIAAFNNEGTNQ